MKKVTLKNNENLSQKMIISASRNNSKSETEALLNRMEKEVRALPVAYASAQRQLQNMIELARKSDPDRALYRAMPFLLAPLLAACGSNRPGSVDISGATQSAPDAIFQASPDFDIASSTAALTDDIAVRGTAAANTISGSDLINPVW